MIIQSLDQNLQNEQVGETLSSDNLMAGSETDTTRVTVVARGVHPPWNEGTRVIARNVSLALQQAGYATNTISLSESSYTRHGGSGITNISYVPSRLSYGIAPDYLYLKQIAHAVNLLNPGSEASAIHLIGAPLALGPLIKGQNRKIVSHVTLSRQVYLSAGEKMRAHLGWRLFDRWIDAYACTSEQIKSDLMHRGYDRRKLRVVNPPLDTDCFKPIPRIEARAILGLAPDDFVVAYVGTISPRRFPADDIVRALNLVAPHAHNLRLEIFAPVATHRRNREWAENNVGQQSQNAQFTVNTRLQDLAETEKALIYSAVDAILLPFTAPVAVEPPLTLLEAMACGATVLAAPFANRSRVVRHGTNGFLFNSVEELAMQLEYLVNLGVEGRARIGSAARQTVLRDYTFANASEQIRKLWTSIGL